jgi:hypothetical protein
MRLKIGFRIMPSEMSYLCRKIGLGELFSGLPKASKRLLASGQNAVA